MTLDVEHTPLPDLNRRSQRAGARCLGSVVDGPPSGRSRPFLLDGGGPLFLQRLLLSHHG